MPETDQLPVKDEDANHPIATVWRPTFRAIVSAWVQGDYRLERGVAAVARVSEATAEQIRDSIAEYGERLVELPDETWQTSVAQWMGTHWDVILDLWTEGEGASDLILDARVYETDGGYRVEVGLVYVP